MTTSLFGSGSAVNVNVNGTLVPQSFTATANQTLFTLSGWTYTPGTNSLLVFINGQRQILTRDFLETSSGSFTLLEGCTAGDYVDVIGFPQLDLTQVVPGSIALGGVYTLSNYISDLAVNVKNFPYLAKGDGVTDDTAAIQAALNSGKGLIYFPEGSYKVTSTLYPKTQQYLLGAQRSKSVIIAGSGFSGTAVISYPSGVYSGISITSLQINANNIAARCLEIIGVTQKAVDQVKLKDLSLALPTTRPIHQENVTYWSWDTVLTNGGLDGGYIYNCYSGETRDCVSYHGSRAAIIIVDGASITLSGHKLFNNTGFTSACLLEIDGGHDIVMIRCEFEPQGTNNVVSEVWIHDSSGSGNCSDIKFYDCSFIGLPTTKTRCLTVGGTTVNAGVSGINIYKLTAQGCRFIKPAAESILLKDQTNTQLIGCVDLITYDTGAFFPVTIINNSPNPYYLEGETGGTFTLTIGGATTNPTITSGTITGTWTKQGKQVNFFVLTGAVTWSVAGTGGFRLRVSGLDLSGGVNNPVTLGICTLFSTAVSAAITSSTEIALFSIGSGSSLTWAAPPVSGNQISLSGTFTMTS